MSEAAVAAILPEATNSESDVWRKSDLPLFITKNGRRVVNVRIDGEWRYNMSVTAIKEDGKGVLITVIGRSSDSTPKDVYYSREDFRPGT